MTGKMTFHLCSTDGFFCITLLGGKTTVCNQNNNLANGLPSSAALFISAIMHAGEKLLIIMPRREWTLVFLIPRTIVPPPEYVNIPSTAPPLSFQEENENVLGSKKWRPTLPHSHTATSKFPNSSLNRQPRICPQSNIWILTWRFVRDMVIDQ